MSPTPYNPIDIERKWQERWERDRLYHVADDDPRPKWYELTMYPYPSGDLHIGHWYAYSPYDAHVRFMRMKGFNVLAPFGFDAFGLPAENAAIKRGIHPHTWTMGNIERMREQIKRMGTALDWDREIICCLPEYYRWNQWFFLQLYKHGLAYRAKAPANWCPTCQTVLANEQVVNGKCERTGDIVERRDMEQWFFRITAYAERLLDFSGLADWPEKIKVMQQNWIGRSEGVELAFDISHYNLPERSIKVFTTRPDTVFGVTFMVLAPEHPLVEKLTSPQEKATVEQYVTQARRASEVERMSTDREKTGVPIGAYCVNPFNGERVPLYIADYVLATYGTGAVMAVPAHDERDFAFAHKNNLPVKIVIKPKGWDGMQLKAAYTEPGEMMNSDELTGTSAEKALDAVANLAERKHIGKRTISYRIRDWLISRQRYWGTPIPVVYCPTDGIVPLSEKDLPVLLPEDAQFKPTGESPLKFHQGFLNTTCPKCHGPAKRETDTMDTFVDSSWYFLRYASPKYDKGPFDPALAKKWAPVDQYTGGAEHAVMHLLYSRFFTKALHDLKLIDFDEPFKRLFNQGIILGEDHEKMSKSRGNVVNPDDFVGRDGADTVRLFLMFVGPWDQGANWSTTGIQGMSRWLTRAWGLATRSAAEHDWKSDNQAIEELERTTHKTVKRVTASLEKFSFNTAIAAMMEFTNELQKYWEGNAVSEGAWKASIEKLLVLMAPFTPHVAEELWEATGRSYSIHQQPWPAYDAEKAKDTEVTLIIQVNGKLRDKFTVSADVTEEQAKALALKSDKVTSMLVDGKQVRKVIYVPGKLVNVVVG